MECSTVYCDIDECAVVLSIKTHTAKKKENICRECRRIIGIGEKYLIESVVFEGKLSNYVTCMDCKSIRDEFFTGGWYWGEILWMLHDHIYDVYGDVSESCLTRLTPLARAKVCDMIEHAWFEQYDEGNEESY